MKRALFLALLAACSTPPTSRKPPDPRDARLDELEAAGARLSSFHAKYEFRDDSTGETREIELALGGPHTAKVSSPGSHLVLFRDGVLRFQTEAVFYEVPFLEGIRQARQRIGLEMEEPTLVFELADWDRAAALRHLRPQLTYMTGRPRFGWLRPLRDPSFVFDGQFTFRCEGDGIVRPAVEAVLEEHGFLVRARILPPAHRGFTLELRSLSMEAPSFDAPPPGDAVDQSADARERLKNAIAEIVERAIVDRFAKTRPAPEKIHADFVAFFRIDLERTCDPAGRLALVRDGRAKDVEHAKREMGRSQDRAASKRFYLDKLRALRNVNLDQIDEMEGRLQEAHRLFLVRDILVPLRAPKEFKQGIAATARVALSQALRETLRDPVAAAYDSAIAELEKEPVE